MVTLTNWAKKMGVQYRTAWNWFKAGKIPGAIQLPSKAIVIPEEEMTTKSDYIVTYARVSSSENRDNLERQSQRLQDFSLAKGWIISENIKEVGSGLNDNRKQLQRFLRQGKVTKIVVEHKDRLTRFGFNYLETLLKHIGCEIIVINVTDNDKDDLMQDFVSIITSFTARLYGLRRSKRKTERIIEELKAEPNN